MIEMEIRGLRETERALGQFELRVRRNMLRKALRAGAAVIGKAARNNVPAIWSRNAPTRLLKRTNIVWRLGRLRGNTLRAKITWRTGRRDPEGRYPFYAHWLEFGTSRLPARPFLRPAMLSHGRKAIEVFGARLARLIEEETAK